MYTHTHAHTHYRKVILIIFANIQHLYQDTIDSLIVGDLIENPITDIQGVIPPPANIKHRIDHLSSILMTSEVLHFIVLFSFLL